MKKYITKKILEIINVEESQIKIEIPPKYEMGDYSIQCVNLRNEEYKNPMEIANLLKEKFVDDENNFSEIKVMGPYLNFYLNYDKFSQTIIDEIQNKEWYELTTEEVQLIKDSKKRSEYRKRVRFCLNCIINPLYDSIKNRGEFKFSVPNKHLTCKIMVKELFEYYKNQGFNKEEIINIAYKADSGKKY